MEHASTDQPRPSPGSPARSLDPREKRRAPRIPLTSVSLPFLGLREEDHLSFQYFLADASRQGAQISIPEWVTVWNRLRVGDRVRLFLPFGVENAPLDRGVIAWLRHDDTHREQQCGVNVETAASPGRHRFSLESDGLIAWTGGAEGSSLQATVAVLLKDSSLLKKNILIYFDHLMPYFSRIVQDREQFPGVRELLFEDIRRQVDEHYRLLKDLSEKVAVSRDAAGGLAHLLDFEQLRSLMESELDQALLQVVFEKETVLWYLQEIKQLENRLFCNYNALLVSQLLNLEQAQ